MNLFCQTLFFLLCEIKCWPLSRGNRGSESKYKRGYSIQFRVILHFSARDHIVATDLFSQSSNPEYDDGVLSHYD